MYKNISLTLLALLASAGCAEAQTILASPKLVVNITIDQLRHDYLEAFAPLYGEDGFKRLLKDGKIYTNVSYPFAPIDRASAVATLATGTTPYYNGIVATQWLNKETLRPTYCVEDKNYNGVYTDDKSSPSNMGTSTIGDELKIASDGNALVFGIAPFRDAAILSAGHAANGAFWIDDRTGQWCTSEYYYKREPDWVKSVNEVYSATHAALKTWEPYNTKSGVFSYFLGGGIHNSFRHMFAGERRFREFKLSGMVNATVTDMALQCMSRSGIGADNITDMLNITYYAGNYNKLPLKDCQMELQDTYVRLDREIARLIDNVQFHAGKYNVVFYVTSTGYCNEETADYAKYRIPSGSFYINRAAHLLNMYYGALWGPDNYVETYFAQQLFLNHKLLEKKKISVTEATSRGQEFLSLMAGVRNVYTSQQLLTTVSQQTEKIRNGFNAEHSGDFIIEVTPGWHILNEDNLDDRVSRASYIQFPIIIFGENVKAERISEHVTTDRIAPTIANAIRIRAPNGCSSAPLF